MSLCLLRSITVMNWTVRLVHGNTNCTTFTDLVKTDPDWVQPRAKHNSAVTPIDQKSSRIIFTSDFFFLLFSDWLDFSF